MIHIEPGRETAKFGHKVPRKWDLKSQVDRRLRLSKWCQKGKKILKKIKIGQCL